MIDFVLILITVEAITEIIVSGDIFIGVRNKLALINPRFLGKLLGCGYCLSVWVAIPFGLIYYLYQNTIYYKVMMAITFVFAIHRLSNMLHELFRRWLGRHPFVLHLFNQSVQPQEEEHESEHKSESIV